MLGELFNFFGLVDQRKRQHIRLLSLVGFVLQLLGQMQQLVGITPQILLILSQLPMRITSRDSHIRRGGRPAGIRNLAPGESAPAAIAPRTDPSLPPRSPRWMKEPTCVQSPLDSPAGFEPCITRQL